jgi:hypothetical protein
VYESYATGRAGIRRLWIEINLASRHDVVAWIVETVGGWLFDYLQSDVVEVTIQPNVEWEGFAWGVVQKSKMRKLKESRYDLVSPSHALGLSRIDCRGLPGSQSRRHCLSLWRS